MLTVRKIAALTSGLVVAGSIWVVFGAFLRSVTDSDALVGGINGLITLLGGVSANVLADRLLGISENADV